MVNHHAHYVIQDIILILIIMPVNVHHVVMVSVIKILYIYLIQTI